jgi:hypothetical protein
MQSKFIIGGIAAGMLAAPATGLLATTAAQAATPGCASAVETHNGETANWCASQEDVSENLMLAAPNKAAAYAQLVAKPTSASNKSEDFQAYPPTLGSGIKIFQFTPNGNATNLCAAINNKGTKLVLKVCSVTKLSEQFQTGSTGADGGVAWDSLANGKAWTIPGGVAYARIVLATDAGQPSQSFTWTQSIVGDGARAIVGRVPTAAK